VLTRGLALLLCLPIVSLLVTAAGWMGGTAQPLALDYAAYVANSLLLALGTGALSLAIGVMAAWYITLYDFPLRRVLEAALLLPLAIPAYIMALIYGHWFDAAGPIQDLLRDASGLAYGDYWFPDIRSIAGSVLVLSLVLYPYVYILARLAFRRQCESWFEAAQLCGVPTRQWLWRVALPIARPALAIGVALVMMETLADFGVVSLFGVSTFTTAIYKSWAGMGDLVTAARLAIMLLLVVLFALWLERFSRRDWQQMQPASQARRIRLLNVSKKRGWFLCAACSLPVVIGFVIPVGQLLFWSLLNSSYWNDGWNYHAATTSLILAVSAAFLACVIGTIFAYAVRHRPQMARWIRPATIGYAVPGSVVAVAVFMPLLLLDRSIATGIEHLTGERPMLFLTGSLFAMVLACMYRFLVVAFGAIDSGLRTISPSVDDAARLLGTSQGRIIRELHWPHLRGSIMVGGLLVFADTMKELPASLLMRPFDVNTLAIRTYSLAQDGLLVQASVPSLMLIAISLLAVCVIAWQQLGLRLPALTRMQATEQPAWQN